MVVTSVVEALERDLTEWNERTPGLAMSGLAAVALALAVKLDDPRISPNAAAQVANSLKEIWMQLRGEAPAVKGTVSPFDEIMERRNRRIARAEN